MTVCEGARRGGVFTSGCVRELAVALQASSSGDNSTHFYREACTLFPRTRDSVRLGGPSRIARCPLATNITEFLSPMDGSV